MHAGSSARMMHHSHQSFRALHYCMYDQLFSKKRTHVEWERVRVRMGVLKRGGIVRRGIQEKSYQEEVKQNLEKSLKFKKIFIII